MKPACHSGEKTFKAEEEEGDEWGEERVMRAQSTTSSGIQANKEQIGVNELISLSEEACACMYVLGSSSFPPLRKNDLISL